MGDEKQTSGWGYFKKCNSKGVTNVPSPEIDAYATSPLYSGVLTLLAVSGADTW